MAFHPLGLDVEPGQLAQQRCGLGEADPCGGEAGHAQGRRRQRGSFQGQRPVPRTEARVAALAVIPGALQFHLAQGGGEGLGSSAGVTGHPAAVAGLLGTLLVGTVGVEAPGEHLAHDPQRQPLGGSLHRLEVQPRKAVRTHQPFDLGLGLRCERRPERRFFSGAESLSWTSRVSHNRSLTSISSRHRPRKRRYSSSCSRARSKAPAGTAWERVLPAARCVISQYGPCPELSGWAQWQVGLPHLRYWEISAPGRKSPMAANSWSSATRRAARLSCSTDVGMASVPSLLIDTTPYQKCPPNASPSDLFHNPPPISLS